MALILTTDMGRIDDLQLGVRGAGPLVLPVTDAQAEQLCRVGRPARYGQGTRALFDHRVRDTWEVPRSRVKIDKRRWDRTLRPILDLLAADLGLPPTSALDAELHSMLVYTKGQFSAPHQDSEKADAMIGTLVVTLPSSIRGGALVIDHGGEHATYRSSKKLLSFVAFYADCRHQVKPVTSGYRVALTYNLLLRATSTAVPDGTAVADSTAVAAATLDALSGCIREHFETPLPAPRAASEAPPPDPPNRLVYMLDHEYTAHALDWGRLKGVDARRAVILREAAALSRCEILLALSDIHETWSASGPDRGEPWYAGSRRRQWDDDFDDDFGDEPRSIDPDDYELEELVDATITLDCWVPTPGTAAEPVSLPVSDLEVCATTPSVDLRPYASEYEGYMGNYGNTMDRWYRRGALVLWPHERAFAVRAEASATWALDTLLKHLRAGDVAGAQRMGAMLPPFWSAAVSAGTRRGLLNKAMRVAHALDEPGLATMLLRPFGLETLQRSHAAPLAALVQRYGEGWTSDLLAVWSPRLPAWSSAGAKDRLEWIATMTRLTTALVTVGDAGTTAARLVLQEAWRWLRETIGQRASITAPSRALGRFLADADRRSFDWPLAEQGRRHVHGRLDGAELPVRHQTRRAGRPYTLVLTKTEALFETERRARAADEANLAWLEENWDGAGRSGRPARGRTARNPP
ncbi:MAG: 2OG-Fe(II) oxygenase [Acidimicrobiales bacterium]